jgi:zinc transporter 1/2/3
MIDYRYISIILIFSSSIIGCLFPFLIKNDYIPFLKMFSAGAILSLALIHIAPESIAELNDISEYPIGGLMILIGLLFLIIIENFYQLLFSKNDDNLNNINLIDNDHHSHVCISNLNIMPQKNTYLLNLYFFEFACVFHSFIIGFSLGLLTDQEIIKKIMVAIIFHQMIEGISLGSMILSSKIGKIKSFIFVMSYSTITLLGIIAGLILEKTSSLHDNDNLPRYLIILRGCFLGISSGILIYISLIQMIMEELSKKMLNIRSSLFIRLYMYLLIISGSSTMAIIALWV